jgi:tRNA pseudouridine38-40 synthase
MARYFIEVAYKGTAYAGFQVQQNANTIQSELEKALAIYFRYTINLTGSSRTDAGVHALQNYFQFDIDTLLDETACGKTVYHLNAILPADIAVKTIRHVSDTAHCRFDAVSRSYVYTIYQFKDPFLNDRGYYYPYQLDMALLNEAASLLIRYTDFESFAKKHNQSFTNQCTLFTSEWREVSKDVFEYHVTGNRFLRGMVRALVGTMLWVGRGKCSLAEFKAIIEGKDPSRANFATPAHGLMLAQVNF